MIMNKKQAKLALKFLESSQLLGIEYKDFTDVVKAIEKLAYTEAGEEEKVNTFTYNKTK